MKIKLILTLIVLLIINSTYANYSKTYKQKKNNHSSINVGIYYFPAKLRKVELTSKNLYLNFPVYNLSVGYTYQINPVVHLGFSYDYFFGNGKNVSKINNYDLETTSSRSGFFIGILSNITININDFFAITHSPALKIGKAEDSLVGTADYNGTKNNLLSYHNKDICLAYVHKLLFDFTFRQRFTISSGILYQFSKIVSGTLWETNEIGDDWVENPQDFGRGFGLLIEYKIWFKKKKFD